MNDIEFIETLKQREMPVIILNHDWHRNCKLAGRT